MSTEVKQHSTAYYRLMEFSRHVWIYVLLIGGSAIFVWPFLWMATTSVKTDRELFGEQIRLMPQTPHPEIRSPYMDTHYFDSVHGERMNELLPALEKQVAGYPGVKDVRVVARGIYQKLLNTLPADQMRVAAINRVDAAMVKEVVGQVRRALLVGRFLARSYDLQEDQLVAPDHVATTWKTDDSQLVQIANDREPYAEWHYDFSHRDKVTLTQTFTTSFPITRLYRLQLFLRNDDTWHELTAYVEKLGVLYKAERAYDLADFNNWSVVTWQEPGPDDKTNKIRNWILLHEVACGPQYVSDPHQIKVTIELHRNSQAGAWWAKIRRNYRLALEHIPFWRYVATSIFLVILNLVGTLFSCSLVAYSFARLQWPGRDFCFALMLATMMIPGQVTMIPYFLIVRSLGWYNTLYPLWVGSFFAGAFNVFLFRQFLRGIPRDLEDAAKIDGCGFWRVYWYVMLPLVKPTLAAIAIFTFMGAWNDFMGPLIYITDQRLYPLSLGLYAFNVEAGGSMSMMMAGSLLMTVPVIVIFFFAQKYFIQGVTLTGMKG